ncbi:LPS-assembly protein LptD [Telmatobacter bradus]|uniref:LPS-assembly protein LptD n=1 Tax=Telmatobacter bradus TaxID=474953 RepID=UPI003B43C2D7
MSPAPALQPVSEPLPDDPSQELIPVAEPEPVTPEGIPVQWDADEQNRAGDVLTLTGHVVFHYRNYILHADHVVYHRASSELEAEGHLQLDGGPMNLHLEATQGDMRLNMHTARFYNVSGTQGIHTDGRRSIYSTPTPLRFTGRVLLQSGEGKFHLIDGTMTNCNLPKPDWQVIAHAINMDEKTASTNNSVFKFLGMPLFYLPYLRRPMDETGRESGILIPLISNSSIKGFISGAQAYWAINRSMDMVVGTEFYSKRGWAPNGDFRYKGNGLDHMLVRWNALLDRGVWENVTNYVYSSTGVTTTTTTFEKVNQGGVDLVAQGRKDLDSSTHVAGTVEYLSNYQYRLVFNDNYSQAISSQVASDLSLSRVYKAYVPSIQTDRFETFASSTTGDEARILHLPSLHFDSVDQQLGPDSPFYWGMNSSLSFMDRSEPRFHARNVGRFDLYPHLSLPLKADGWSLTPEVGFRNTTYSISQNPDLADLRHGVPSVNQNPLNRFYGEARLDAHAPAIERDFVLPGLNRVLRHVIEPEAYYHYVGGVGKKEQNVVLIDTTDIATDTNEVGFWVNQRFYLKPLHESDCTPQPDKPCAAKPREWASWTVGQKFFIDPDFGGAIITGRRNVFDSTLDLTGVAFLTDPHTISPIISRLRFEAIDDIRIEWDVDYDPHQGQLSSDNLYAGYTHGTTTIGLGHALLNAVDESRGSASTIKSQLLQPFVSIGKPSKSGLNMAANVGYDFVLNELQYGGAQATYNWDCCGLTLGYRRFELGSVRNETQWLYSFTLANFGSVGDIRRSNSVFRDPSLPPAF